MKSKPVEFQIGEARVPAELVVREGHVASGVEETARGCGCERWSGGEVVVALLLAALIFMGGIVAGLVIATMGHFH